MPTIKFFERALKLNQETAPFSNESPINNTCLKQQNTILMREKQELLDQLAFYKYQLETICQNSGIQMPVYRKVDGTNSNDVSILKQPYESLASSS